MQRNQSLVAILALILVAGGLAFWFSSEGDAPPTGPTDVQAAAIDSGDTRNTGRQTDSGSDNRTAARVPTAEASNGPGSGDLHPSVREALAGFEGRVVHGDGTPAAESLVRLYRFALDQAILPGAGLFQEPGNMRKFPDAFAAEQRTDADGKFRITGVFPRAFFLLRADVDGDAPTNRIIQRTPGPAEMVDLGDIVLQDCGVLIGKVLDDAGEPVPGALVRAIDIPGQFLALYPAQRFDPEGGVLVDADGFTRVFALPDWVAERFEELPIPTTRTAADGSFRLGGVVPGGNLFTIYQPGWLDHTRDRVDVEAGEETDLGEIRLREGEIAGGRVLDQEGDPIAEAEVLIAEASPNSNVPVHLAHEAPSSAADGSFELGGFPAGEVYGAARRRASDPWTIVGPIDVLDDLDIVLPSEHSLTVRVVDPEDEPIADARIQVQVGDAQEGAFEMAMFGMTEPVRLEGRMRRGEDGAYRIEGLSSGEYAVLVDAPGRAINSADVKLDEDAEITVVLEGEVTFQAIAIDETGAPVAGAEVYAMARGARPRLPDAPVWVGTTDEDGLVKVDGVRATEVALTGQHPAYGTAHARSPLPVEGEVAMTFLSPGTIVGNLLEGGAEPEPGKWMVLCTRSWRSDLAGGGGGGMSGGASRGALPDMPRIVTPALDGQFVVRGVKPGTYELQVVRSMDMLTSPGKSVQFATSMMMMGETDEQSVQVASGQTAQITLDALAGKMVTGPAATVTGTLIIDGLGAGGYLVSARSDGRRFSAETDVTGRFDLGLIPAGNVRLEIMPKPSGDFLSFRRMGDELWRENFPLEEGVDKDLMIELQLTSISGTVVTAAGTPASNVRVRARGVVKRLDDNEQTNSVSFREETDSSGRFEFDRVPAGIYSLTVSDDELGRTTVENIEALAGLGASGLRIILEPVFTVRGSIDMAFFGEEKPRWLGLQFERTDVENGSREWAGVDSDTGTFSAGGLSPGTYRITCYGSGVEGTVRATAPIQLGNRDLENVTVTLQREQPATSSGK